MVTPRVQSSTVLPGRLRPIAPFSTLSAEQLIVAAGYTQLSAFRAGETIIEQGSDDPNDYFLLEGKVELLDVDQQCKTIDAGSPASNVALANARPSLYRITALEQVICASMPRQTVALLREQARLLKGTRLTELERTVPHEDRLQQSIKADIEADRLRLPSQPDLVLRLRSAIARSNCTNRTVADLIAVDPAIVAKLMKIANSPLCRGRDPVVALPEAIARIGMHSVSELVVCFSLKDLFKCSNAALRKQFAVKVGEAVRIGAMSNVVATRVCPELAEQALVAGLLTNIGAYAMLERLADDELSDAVVAAESLEPQLISELGALICQRWNFDRRVVAALENGYRWDYQSEGEIDLATVVVCARFHAWLGLGGDYRKSLPPPGEVPALRILEPYTWPQDNLDIVRAANDRVDALMTALG